MIIVSCFVDIVFSPVCPEFLMQSSLNPKPGLCSSLNPVGLPYGPKAENSNSSHTEDL